MKKGKALAEAYAAAPSPDVSVVTPLGYQTPAEFYSPTYDTEEKYRANTPDYRTTLYWNPVVKLDDLGQATVEFYTTDAPADYNVQTSCRLPTANRRTAEGIFAAAAGIRARPARPSTWRPS